MYVWQYFFKSKMLLFKYINKPVLSNSIILWIHLPSFHYSFLAYDVPLKYFTILGISLSFIDSFFAGTS